MAKHRRYNIPDTEEENFLKGINQKHTPDAGDFATTEEDQTFMGTPPDNAYDMFDEEDSQELLTDKAISDNPVDVVFQDEVVPEVTESPLDEYYRVQGDFEEIILNEEPIVIMSKLLQIMKKQHQFKMNQLLLNQRLNRYFG